MRARARVCIRACVIRISIKFIRNCVNRTDNRCDKEEKILINVYRRPDLPTKKERERERESNSIFVRVVNRDARRDKSRISNVEDVVNVH